jgi:surface protein
MFVYCENLTKLNLSSFNTSKVTTMNHMFANCSSLTKIDLSNFNTSNVQIMGNMFGYCTALTELDISSFDTSKVTNMNRMFDHCTLLEKLDISSFDTSSTTTMTRMFANNLNLTTIYVSDKWTIEKVNHSGISTEDQPFIASGKIVGGAGTKWNSAYVDISYARIDGGPNSQTPGYLTFKSST